jgi:hypothetical protein
MDEGAADMVRARTVRVEKDVVIAAVTSASAGETGPNVPAATPDP